MSDTPTYESQCLLAYRCYLAGASVRQVGKMFELTSPHQADYMIKKGQKLAQLSNNGGTE